MMRLLKSLLWAVTGAAVGRRMLRSRPSKPRPPSRKERLIRLGKHFALFVVILAVGGFLVAASGIVSIKASSGHWAVTRWFLNFSSGRSVALHSSGITAPPLDDPALVLKGAGHYETGCKACHGSPERFGPSIARAMTPKPPDLRTAVPQWDSNELFYIVKHGIKFTGMPAWPAFERDDEVWAMVAFLRALPDMGPEEYERLVFGPAPAETGRGPLQALLPPEEPPRIIAENCARCHGETGGGRGLGAFPKLAGQRPDYLYGSLTAYARGNRRSGIMQPVASGLDPEAMREIALYYARLTPVRTARAGRGDADRGREIAMRGVPERRVPACVHCHGPSATRRNPFYPVLAGQYADYLELQLGLFKTGVRGGLGYQHLMHEVVRSLTREEMRDVAAFYASLQ